MGSIYFNPDSKTDVYERNLPHWQQLGKMYFITFRLADSIPAEKLSELSQKQEQFKQSYSPPYTSDQEKEYRHLFYKQLDIWMDNCMGSCILADQRYAEIVKSSLEFYNEQKYMLDHWVIMPNHVHVLAIVEDTILKQVTHGWKSFSARKMNAISGNSGQVWQHESFDHIVRSEFYLEKYRNYIVGNWLKSGKKALLSINKAI